METQYHISLKSFNTFGIEAVAKQYCNITTVTALATILQENKNNPILVLSGGSNILITRDIEALVLHINIKGITITKETETHVIVKAMAGENWHNFVQWCLAKDYGGLENLSLIPGNVGTAPIQNIGAYGVELKDSFMSCTAMHILTQAETTFSKDDCKFHYRESIFKQELKSQYIITSVTFQLTKNQHKLHINYGAIKEQLRHLKVKTPTIQEVSRAVIAIRQRKLPDPNHIGNSGSFFKNPTISIAHFEALKRNFPNIPSYPIDDATVKIPAGWLIEKAGFKGKRFGNYGVHQHQALVLVNYGKALGSDILKFSKLIQNTIKRLFDISIETEVNII